MALLLNCDLIVSIVVDFNIPWHNCLLNPRLIFTDWDVNNMFSSVNAWVNCIRFLSLSKLREKSEKLYQTFLDFYVASLPSALLKTERLSPADDYLVSFHFLLNRFSSKLRYIFCMLIFFQVLLEINNGKIIFLRDNSGKKGASSSPLLSSDSFRRALFQVKVYA